MTNLKRIKKYLTKNKPFYRLALEHIPLIPITDRNVTFAVSKNGIHCNLKLIESRTTKPMAEQLVFEILHYMYAYENFNSKG